MLNKNLFIRLRSLVIIFAAILFFSSASAANHQTVLYNFGNPPDATGPYETLFMDGLGNLYGASQGGGLYGGGTVFELSRAQGGGWTETVLYSFGNGDDASSPNGYLIMDAAGNLYGTSISSDGGFSAGTVFEVSPNPGGGWTEMVLYRFSGNVNPNGGLVMDTAGNLYGTTEYGGANDWGAVFELSPNPGGGWTETVLHSFSYGSNDGHSPLGNLVMDAAGNLYGTTYNGGEFCQMYGCGTVFELSPNGGGGWTETLLHSFDFNDGFGPWAGLVMDAAGNLYGTTVQGGNLTGPVCGPSGCGTVFEVSPVAGDGWTETTLYNFNGQPDAGYPLANLILDAGGNLYGATPGGGADNFGSVFELSPTHGAWVENVLYSFTGSANNGPGLSGPIMNRLGQLYGLAGGGTNQHGIAYELTSPFICTAGCR